MKLYIFCLAFLKASLLFFISCNQKHFCYFPMHQPKIVGINHDLQIIFISDIYLNVSIEYSSILTICCFADLLKKSKVRSLNRCIKCCSLSFIYSVGIPFLIMLPLFLENLKICFSLNWMNIVWLYIYPGDYSNMPLLVSSTEKHDF